MPLKQPQLNFHSYLLVKHGKSVVLMRVGAEIKQLPVSAAEKQGAFVQIRRKAPVPSFQPDFVRQKRIIVQISGAVNDGVDEGFRRIFEGDLGA